MTFCSPIGAVISIENNEQEKKKRKKEKKEKKERKIILEFLNRQSFEEICQECCILEGEAEQVLDFLKGKVKE